MIFAISPDIVIFLAVLGAAAVIAVVAFLIYLYLKPRLKHDDKPTEEQILHEEMGRILKPVEDDDAAKAIEEYKDEDE
jgi:membrane protein implicated in regulation of membrane protease activity